jgi:iron complex transport system substrate-binding protein
MVIPGGVLFWDGGPESALLMLYYAKKVHPELFQDLDLRIEVQEYYKRFYNCNLSNDEADRLLLGLDSKGQRGNLWCI